MWTIFTSPDKQRFCRSGRARRIWADQPHHAGRRNNYDFNQTFNESFTSGTTVTVERSNVRLLHGDGVEGRIGPAGLRLDVGDEM